MCEGLKSQEIIDNTTYQYISDLLLNCFELATGLITTEHLNIPSNLPIGDEPMSRSNTNSPPLFQYGEKTSNHRKSAFSLNFKDYSFQSKVNELASQVGMISGDTKQKRKTLGRQLKLCSDLYLMTGRFQQAFHLYQKSIEINKSNNDPLWLASSIEGFLCTIIYLQACDSLGQTTSVYSGKSSSKIWGEIVQRYSTEIVDLYAKTDYPLLVIETNLKISKLTSVLHRFGLTGQAPLLAISNDNLDPLDAPLTHIPQISRNLVSNWAALIINENFFNLDPYFQITLLIQLGQIYGSINYLRKRAYYYKLASQKFLTTQAPAKFSLKIFQNPKTQIVPYLTSICQGYLLNLDGDEGWISVQQKLYRTVLSICEASDNQSLFRHYLIQNLIQLKSVLTQPDQEVILSKLQKCIACSTEGELTDVDNFNVPFEVKFLELKGTEIDTSANNDKKSPFLYSPYKSAANSKLDKKPTKLNLEIDQNYLISISVENPFKVELKCKLTTNMDHSDSNEIIELEELEIKLKPGPNEVQLPLNLAQIGEYKLKGITLNSILNSEQVIEFIDFKELVINCGNPKPSVEFSTLTPITGYNLVPLSFDLKFTNLGKCTLKEIRLLSFDFELKEEYRELEINEMYYRDQLVNLIEFELTNHTKPSSGEQGSVEFKAKFINLLESIKLRIEVRDDNNLSITIPLTFEVDVKELVSVSKFSVVNEFEPEFLELTTSKDIIIDSNDGSNPKGLIKLEFVNNYTTQVTLNNNSKEIKLQPNSPSTLYQPFNLITLTEELDAIPILETQSSAQFVLKQCTKEKEELLKKLFWCKEKLLKEVGEFSVRLENNSNEINELIPINLNIELSPITIDTILKPTIWISVKQAQTSTATSSKVQQLQVTINNHSQNPLHPQLTLNNDNIKVLGMNPMLGKKLKAGEVDNLLVNYFALESLSTKEKGFTLSLVNLIGKETVVDKGVYVI